MGNKSLHSGRLHSNLPNKTMTEQKQLNISDIDIGISGTNLLRKCSWRYRGGNYDGEMCGGFVIDARCEGIELNATQICCRRHFDINDVRKLFEDFILKLTSEPEEGRCIYKYTRGPLLGKHCGNIVEQNVNIPAKSLENLCCSNCMRFSQHTEQIRRVLSEYVKSARK